MCISFNRLIQQYIFSYRPKLNIFLDLSKAFDTINHGILCQKSGKQLQVSQTIIN